MTETTPTANPRDVACPACYSPAGQPCTQPTDTSRKPVSWVHYAREHAATEVTL
jgi:hypothetical protein